MLVKICDFKIIRISFSGRKNLTFEIPAGLSFLKLKENKISFPFLVSSSRSLKLFFHGTEGFGKEPDLRIKITF